MHQKNLLAIVWGYLRDLAVDFMKSENVFVSFVRRSISNVAAMLYVCSVLHYFHTQPNRARFYLLEAAITAALLFGLIYPIRHQWRRRNERMPWKEQKPYQLFLIHSFLAIAMVVLLVFPKVEEFFWRM